MRDRFASQAQVEREADDAIKTLPEASGEKNPLEALEDRNDGALGEFGVLPAELRRAARAKRPDIA